MGTIEAKEVEKESARMKPRVFKTRVAREVQMREGGSRAPKEGFPTAVAKGRRKPRRKTASSAHRFGSQTFWPSLCGR